MGNKTIHCKPQLTDTGATEYFAPHRLVPSKAPSKRRGLNQHLTEEEWPPPNYQQSGNIWGENKFSAKSTLKVVLEPHNKVVENLFLNYKNNVRK